MAVVMVDGFDLYNGTGTNTGIQAKWASPGSASLVSGRFTGQALRVVNSTTIQRSFTATANLTAGFAIRFNSIPTVNTIFGHLAFKSGGTFQCGLALRLNASLEAFRLSSSQAGTSLGASSVSLIAAATWYYLEVEVVISTTVGRITAYLGGVQVINVTGVNTANAGVGTTADTILFILDNGSTGLTSFDVDDLYLLDAATKLGERRVETLYPTSDVAQGWTRSTGATNYTLVDEATANGDTDYVQASAVNDLDTYGFGNLTGTPATIDAVQLAAFAEKTDATSRSIALQAISGATTSDGSNFSLAASYGKFERLMLTDPNGSIAWTAANVNALTGGPKVTV